MQHPKKSSLSQRGFSTIAVLAGLAIIGIVSVGTARYSIDTANRSVGTGVGVALDQVNQAVGTYVFNNQFALLAGSSIPNGSGTVADPRSPTIAELQSLVGFNGNFTQEAGNGGNYVISITNLPIGCLGSSCNLAYQTYINRPFLDDRGGYFGKLIEAAIAASPGTVGSSTPEDPTLVRGGNWTISNPAGTTVGILMAVGGTGSSIFNQFVKLGDTRDPGLQGNLTIAGSASANTLTVTTTAAIGKVALTDTVVQGAACVNPTGSVLVSKDAAGLVLSCQGGVWVKASGPVSNVVTGSYAGSGTAIIGTYSVCTMGGSLFNSGSSNYLYAQVYPASSPNALGKSSWGIYVSSAVSGLPVYYTCFDV